MMRRCRYLENKLTVDALNREVFHAVDASIDEIMLGTQTLPFMTTRRLIIVKEANRIRSADADKLAAFLKNPVKSTCLVLMWPDRLKKENKKNGLLSVIEQVGDIAEFRLLYDRELPGWITAKVKEYAKEIAPDAVQALVNESGSGLLDLANELEKLDLYTGARSGITLKDVETVSGHTRQANLNNLAEAVEGKDGATALQVLENLMSEGEIPLKMLATIARVMRRMLIAKSMLLQKKSSPQEIRQELNLNPYFDKNFFTNLSRYTPTELLQAMNKILQSDIELKSSSKPEAMIFEELLSGLCRQ